MPVQVDVARSTAHNEGPDMESESERDDSTIFLTPGDHLANGSIEVGEVDAPEI